MSKVPCQKYPVYIQFEYLFPRSTATIPFRDTRLSRTLTCICKKYLVYIEYLPPSRNFSSISPYNPPFSRYLIVENQKCTEWPYADLEYLTVNKSIHYTLNTYIQGNKISILLKNQPFSKHNVAENENKIMKNRKLKISKIPNSIFAWASNKKNQEEFEKH